MPSLIKRWLVAPRLSQEADLALHGYPPILRQILYNRGFASHEAARMYLEAQPPPGTAAMDMLGIPAAVDRILFAVQHHEPIIIYGDYDADGVTATALLIQVLRSLGAQVKEYIPNRFDEGYGLNIDAITFLSEQGARLVVTVDCGIRSLAEADHARSLGLDLIITDHHHPGSEIPNAYAVINPKQLADSYPEKDLAGVGLAYKLASALLEKAPTGLNITDTLDLVALGTVADLAPLVGENRSLVRQGLNQIRQPHRQGLLSLIGSASLNPRRISSYEIGYVLGPRLNAAGRLDSALAAFRILTTNDLFEASQLAQLLDNQNRERQRITLEITRRVEQMIQFEEDSAPLLFAADPEFNSGVVGLVASRLVEQYYRPAIVAQQGETHTRASCRSIPEFHITQALDQCADLLDHHGGHSAAAGFTVQNERLPELVSRLKAIARDQLSVRDLRPTLYADLEIPLAELKPEILEYLDWLQPTGYGNRSASFTSRRLRVLRSQAVGKDSAHLKLAVTDGIITFDAIAFRQAYWLDQMPTYVDLLYSFEMNEFNGRQTLQLNVRDLKPSGRH